MVRLASCGGLWGATNADYVSRPAWNVTSERTATPQTRRAQVEQGARGTGGVARSQNAVFVLPHDWTSIAQILRPLLDRVDENARELQLLIIASDAEVAAAVVAAAVKLTAGRDVGLIAATSARRA